MEKLTRLLNSQKIQNAIFKRLNIDPEQLATFMKAAPAMSDEMLVSIAEQWLDKHIAKQGTKSNEPLISCPYCHHIFTV